MPLFKYKPKPEKNECSLHAMYPVSPFTTKKSYNKALKYIEQYLVKSYKKAPLKDFASRNYYLEPYATHFLDKRNIRIDDFVNGYSLSALYILIENKNVSKITSAVKGVFKLKLIMSISLEDLYAEHKADSIRKSLKESVTEQFPEYSVNCTDCGREGLLKILTDNEGYCKFCEHDVFVEHTNCSDIVSAILAEKKKIPRLKLNSPDGTCEVEIDVK